jgi:hypothetical protein
MKMDKIALHTLGRSISTAISATLLAACAADTTFAPNARPDLRAQLSPTTPGLARLDLGTCETLRAPEGSTFASHVYAKGVQIYRWEGSWVPVAPSAVLYADAEGHGVVGTHYSGPRWRSISGSTVKGAVIDRCVADANAIPWLSIGATYEGGPGVFQRVTFIQRVNTVGGKAPSYAGSAMGEVVRVPYTAEYYFYRAP